jgi:hypothetical protein
MKQFENIKIKRIQEVPLLMRLEATFSQEGNTLGTTEEFEDLIIAMEYQNPPDPGTEGDGFFTLKTDTGWSIDSVEEISKLIESVKQAAIQIGETKKLCKTCEVTNEKCV